MKHFLTRFLAVVSPAILFISCSDSGPESKGKIGVSCMDLTNPFFKLIANVMAEEAAKHGYEVVALDGANEPGRQNAQLGDFAAQRFDAVFLNPVDSRAVGEGVKKLHDAGVPVFTFDIQIEDPEAKELVVHHIGSDNYQGGQLAAESMIKVTGDNGKIAILGLPEVSSCILRVQGFKDRLQEKGSKLEIVTELSGGGNRNDGFAVTNDILQAHPDIAGIFAINDPSGLGAHAAVTKANRADDIHIVAFDASPAGKQGVFEKKLVDTPQQFPRKMAVGTVEAFIKHLEGVELEKRVFIPCEHYVYETSVHDESREKEQW